MRMLFYVTLLFLALQPLAADDSLEALLQRAPFSEAEKRSIEGVFESARGQDIPDAFLLPRLEEGIAKRIPAAQLLPVLRRELEFLSRAREILAAAAPHQDHQFQQTAWLRTALLLHKGVPYAAIAAIAEASVKRWPDFRAATELYLALNAWGLESTAVQGIVVAVLSSRVAAVDFAGVAALFPKGRTRYLAPRVLADRIIKTLPSVESAVELERRVLY